MGQASAESKRIKNSIIRRESNQSIQYILVQYLTQEAPVV